MKKRIMTRFSTSQAYAREAKEKISDFLLETGYIEARLRGEDRPYNPNYNNTIETLDQYREWLIAYEEKTRIYKKSDKC